MTLCNWYWFYNSSLEIVMWVFVNHCDFFVSAIKTKVLIFHLKLYLLNAGPALYRWQSVLMFAHYRFQVSTSCWSKLLVTRGLPFRLVLNSFNWLHTSFCTLKPKQAFHTLGCQVLRFLFNIAALSKKTATPLLFYFLFFCQLTAVVYRNIFINLSAQTFLDRLHKPVALRHPVQ